MVLFDIKEIAGRDISLRINRTTMGDPARKRVPAYYFDIIDKSGNKVGFCDLRVGHTEELYYGGNIGYTVFEEYRGNHYARKAGELLLELAKRHGMEYLYITCQPHNIPSRKTCEALGGELIEIAELPEDNEMRLNDGHTCECIYYFKLTGDR